MNIILHLENYKRRYWRKYHNKKKSYDKEKDIMTLSKNTKGKIIALKRNGELGDLDIAESCHTSTFIVSKVWRYYCRKYGNSKHTISNEPENQLENPFDENFFKKETRRRDYVWGASIPCMYLGFPSENIIRFTSKYQELAYTVANHMNVIDSLEAKIISERRLKIDKTKKQSFHFQKKWKAAYEDLVNLGVVEDKNMRAFPDSSETSTESLRDILRGFNDGQGHFHNKYLINTLSIIFNEHFMEGFQSFLDKELGIKRELRIYKDKRPQKALQIVLPHDECLEFGKYIYEDMNEIIKQEIFLEKQYKLFRFNHRKYQRRDYRET